jgi:large subunit ribosomal protein L25
MPVLKCTKRDESIKVKALRRKEFAPAIIYGKNLKENVKIQISNIDIGRLMRESAVGSVVTVDVDGEKYNALLKQVDYMPLSTKVQHIDFQVLTAGEKIKTSAPVRFINKNQVSSEGTLKEHLHAIDYEVLPSDIVDHFEVDLSKLEIGNDIKLGDLDFANDERYNFLTPPETSLASLQYIKVVEDETEEAEDGEESAEAAATEEADKTE